MAAAASRLPGLGVLGATASPMLHHSLLHDKGGGAALPPPHARRSRFRCPCCLAAEAAYAAMLRACTRSAARTRARTGPTATRQIAVDLRIWTMPAARHSTLPWWCSRARALTWPATVTPSSFVFQPGEAFRDVVLHVDAPDGPGRGRPFQRHRLAGRCRVRATVTITTEADMAGCSVNLAGPGNDAGEGQVLGRVLGGAALVALLTFLEAVAHRRPCRRRLRHRRRRHPGRGSGRRGARLLHRLGRQLVRPPVQDLVTITPSGCACAGKTGILPFHDNDRT